MVIIIFGLPLTYAYAMLRQSVAGNSTFRGIVFCNLGTPKTVLSNFVTSRQIETPYLSPYGYPNNVPGGQKSVKEKKMVYHKYVLIPWYPISYLTIASYGFCFWGAYAGAYNRPNGFFFVFFLADLSYVGFVLVGNVLDIQQWKTNFTFCVQN